MGCEGKAAGVLGHSHLPYLPYLPPCTKLLISAAALSEHR